MDLDVLATGGIGAAVAATIMWLARRIGAYAARQKWTHTIETEDVRRIAEERDAALRRAEKAEREAAVAQAVAAACQKHMTRQLRGVGRSVAAPAVEKEGDDAGEG